MSDVVKYGDPFVMSVDCGNVSGVMDNSNYGMLEPVEHERRLLFNIREECQEFGCESYIYICVPVARIWTDDPGDPNDTTNAPNRVVQMEWANDMLQRMARAAIAMGVSDEAGGVTHT